MPRLKCLISVFLIAGFAFAGPLNAQFPKPGGAGPQEERKAARFSKWGVIPLELLFGDFRMGNGEETKCAGLLAEGEPHQKLAAARELWEGHSRDQAFNVLKYLAGPPPGGDEFRKLQREVEASLQAPAILRELKEGDYRWGTWLAFLRPHGQLVPTLLAALTDKPVRGQLAGGKGKSEMFPETMLALGNSGDPRALEPLLQLLKSDDYRIAGDAANALGYLGNADVEPKLIAALTRDKDQIWLQLNACRALGKLGSRKALPALEKLANDDRYTGALNVRGMAADAIERITMREER